MSQKPTFDKLPDGAAYMITEQKKMENKKERDKALAFLDELNEEYNLDKMRKGFDDQNAFKKHGKSKHRK